MRSAFAAMLVTAVVIGSAPAPAAAEATGSAVGRVTALHRGMPAVADSSWKVRFTPRAAGGEPVELPLTDGTYETPELPVGAYDVQVVNAFGQPVGAPQAVVLTPGVIRADLRVEMGPEGGEGKSSWKVWAIVGGAAAALALAAGGGDGGSDAPASPVN
jgi:hypothetical protein